MMSAETWSRKEKAVARRAFDLALERECEALMVEVRTRAAALKVPDDVWSLHDFLSQRRRDIDRKYDYRYSVLHIVFVQLIGEGWLTFDDLDGLHDDKIAALRRSLEVLGG